ncbi:MAG: cbb3-type cytochrome c oxidase subunit I [Flavobacteriales bacterium]|jgi:cytochrome c oxidase cbb3-type subunit 1|nr:cbb3-type cytochrome c oxidase subunit I [Flavobacteriales bacterium]
MAQSPKTEDWMLSPGVVGTLVLLGIVLFIAVLVMTAKVNRLIQQTKEKRAAKNGGSGLSEEERARREAALQYKLRGDELGGSAAAFDAKALVAGATSEPGNPLVDEKIYSHAKLDVPKPLQQLVIWYLAAATFWLLFGTAVGEYLGLKFIWPDLDEVAWLSFGRLRPVHTNTVFWGWASLAMIGLAYFVIARTSVTKIYSYKWGWWAFGLINFSVIVGNLCLMAGINNGGGEYREYIWPAMLPFALGLIITFRNFYATVKRRKIPEIYVSNWYLLASLIWTIVLSIIGYLPYYQDGLGETITQGYYMHQGVGMWFMTFTLGLIYYYLPSALNKPIYSYSLGVLAFWTQMLFYTMIGTHHFIFSPLPWWLQTVAIVFSMGMFIPVIAGTTNFLMTMRGSWSAIGRSYVLPFFLVGVIFYFVGSAQGSFQAFRFTQAAWHFTDFNVAHSHMTMYGIITFILWACMYALLPKMTGREPSQLLVGAHFWLAFIGLFAYTVSLMAGGMVKGLAWMEGVPFIDTVIATRGYWTWRAVGGTLMFISHCIFAWNFYIMVRQPPRIAVRSLASDPISA